MGKKLYKKRSEAMLFGVCAGLAEYFGLDVNLVRLATVAAGCIGGIGVIVYIAAVFLLPDA